MTRTAIAAGCAIVAVIAAGYVRNQDATVSKAAIETHTWACAFKNGLRQDYLATRRYIIDVRRGRRQLIPGITMADLRDGQERRLGRILETRSLDCT